MQVSTKRILSDSLVSILQNEQVDKITVKDIVTSCDLTRQTFYNHFSDIYELVEWTASEAADKALANVSDYENWQRGFYNVMIEIKKNKNLVLNTYQSVYRDLLEKYLYEVIYSYIIVVVERQAIDMSVEQNHKDFIAHFYSLAFISLIFEWVKDGMKDDPKDIVEQTGVLVEGDFKKALNKYAK
ncbi:dihydroxyacetone kinase transcriptional activator DhaS [Companilactobacillus allii]|uniref:Dihydroxyacetone kinase transcriptional activator DhaS n=2 Tax=Companilactobacillus allii TaxID=1847728 RepID=A0A1P8Q0Z2_9LACO|nr:TetR-like C-terminal domain-containing protein [Companilactobacillus allii]APX71495.1 dihydroxyacetone kinase transcriptional activator DhaS [Companilactobacillus allii]